MLKLECMWLVSRSTQPPLMTGACPTRCRVKSRDTDATRCVELGGGESQVFSLGFAYNNVAARGYGGNDLQKLFVVSWYTLVSGFKRNHVLQRKANARAAVGSEEEATSKDGKDGRSR